MDEMQGMMEGGGEESPRLKALERLLDFIAQSETSRAMPPEVPPETPAAPGEEELGEDVLGGLRGLPEDTDEDGM